MTLSMACGTEPVAVEAERISEPEPPPAVVVPEPPPMETEPPPPPIVDPEPVQTIELLEAWPRALTGNLDEMAEGAEAIRFRSSGPVRFDYRVGSLQHIGSGVPRELEDGTFEIRIGTNSLGGSLLLAPPDAIHTVVLRGDRVEESVEFTLALTAPPAILSGCTLSDDLDGFRLDDLSFADLFDGRSVQVMTAQLEYTGLFGPMVTVEASASIAVHVTQVGEDKFTAPGFTPLWISSFEELPSCPFNVSGGGTAIVNGISESTAFWSGQTTCDLSGYYPDHTTVVADLISTPVPQPGRVLGRTAGRRTEIEVLLQDPRVELDGVTYDWSTDPGIPTGFVAAAESSRYYLPIDLFHVGTDRYLESPTNPVQERAFETRPFVERAEVVIQPLTVALSHPTIPHLQIPLIRDASCAEQKTYATVEP